MRITVRYLGAFAETGPAKEKVYELALVSIGDLMTYLLERNGDKFRRLLIDPATGAMRSGITLLVNGARAAPHHILSDNDEVTLLTPLAGG